ncbi:MAG TPA: hypothetical protein EYP41_10970 [Anaerolineae bacterium]|nr:hypothetical protein [Anaerolineae bacterium]
MAKKNNLVPLDQRIVEFYGDELVAVRADNNRVYVSLRHMCQALDIDTTAQRQRIQRHNVLNDGLGVCKIQTPGGMQNSYVLRVDLVPLWLTGIRTSMIRQEIRIKLEKFQKEAAAVLWEAFQEGRLTADPQFETLLNQNTDAVQAYKMATAVVKLARQQILLEGRLGDTELRLDNVEDRLATVEEQLSGSQTVTEDQASQLSQAVKTVAIALGKQTKKNEFGAVYGEMYRKFGITSYKLLPANRFTETMAWLTEWHQQIAGDAPF